MQSRIVTREDYQNRINVVIEYINHHLGEEIDLKTLAGISNFSAFHFHRIFKAMQEETLAAYISRIRMEKAALLLRYSELAVENIAYQVGFGSPSSLSRAFKLFYGISPIIYKTNQNIYLTKSKEMKTTNQELQSYLQLSAQIINRENQPVIYIHLTGSPDQVDYPGAYARLWNFLAEENLLPAEAEHIGIYHDDPNVTPADKLRSDVCLTIHKEVKPRGDIGVKNLAGGRYAVFHYQGPYHHLGTIHDMIFREWLPNSGYELRDEPFFEKFVSDPTNTPPDKQLVEIYFPIQ